MGLAPKKIFQGLRLLERWKKPFWTIELKLLLSLIFVWRGGTDLKADTINDVKNFSKKNGNSILLTKRAGTYTFIEGMEANMK